ncbi:MAG: MoaD/ThiS family protein [Candidatus Woesearchaeota archaeon]
MKIKVYVDNKNKNLSIDAKNIKEIIDKLKINASEFIIVKNDELVTSETNIKNGDNIKFLSVVSGG